MITFWAALKKCVGGDNKLGIFFFNWPACKPHHADAMVHWLHGYMPYHLQLETINEAISRAGTIYHPSLFVIQNLVFFPK